jgi:hypothetical protein
VGAYLLGFSNLSPRPQALAYPIFGMFLFAVTRAVWRRDTRFLWLLPPLMIVWANVHGSFFMGFVLIGCALVSQVVTDRSVRAARPFVLTLIACGLGAVVTPYGPGSLIYVASMGSNPIIRDFVTEWAPSSIGMSEGVFFFASVVVMGALALRSPARLTIFEVLLLAAFGWLAISSVRAIVWWGLISAPIATRLLAAMLPRPVQRGRELPALNLLVLASVAAMVFASLPWVKDSLPLMPADKRGLVAAESPVGAADYLRANPPAQGRMLNHLAWAGYLEWVDWPAHEPFLDGRIEIHPPQVWMDFLTMTFPGAGWRSLLDQYDIGYAVLDRHAEADLVADLQVEPGWRTAYEDDQAVVFVRA